MVKVAENGRKLSRGELAERLLSIHAARDFHGAVTATIETLEHQIECDWASISYSPAVAGGQRRFWSSRRREQERVTGPSGEFYRQHPLWRAWWSTLKDQPNDMTRCVPESRLKETDIYDSVFRPLRIRRMIGQCMQGGFDFAIGVIRERPTDFADEDLEIVQCTARHLALAVGNLARAKNGWLDIRGRTEPVSAQAFVRTDLEERILAASPEARMLLEPHFGKLNGRLPPSLSEWLGRGGVSPVRRPLGNGMELRVTRLEPRFTFEGPALHLTVGRSGESGGPRLAERCDALNLTDREQQVAGWLVAGKTNAEIGVILGISPATAKTHVERILRKARVENRTAFASLVLDETGL